MRPPISASQVRDIKQMIAESNLNAEFNNSTHHKFVKKAVASGHLFQFTGKERQLVHQFNIAQSGGLPPELLRPFAFSDVA
jgi:hypothetical protein